MLNFLYHGIFPLNGTIQVNLVLKPFRTLFFLNNMKKFVQKKLLTKNTSKFLASFEQTYYFSYSYLKFTSKQFKSTKLP